MLSPALESSDTEDSGFTPRSEEPLLRITSQGDDPQEDDPEGDNSKEDDPAQETIVFYGDSPRATAESIIRAVSSGLKEINNETTSKWIRCCNTNKTPTLFREEERQFSLNIVKDYIDRTIKKVRFYCCSNGDPPDDESIEEPPLRRIATAPSEIRRRSIEEKVVRRSTTATFGRKKGGISIKKKEPSNHIVVVRRKAP